MAAGVCHTDLTAQAGKLPVSFPVVLGHEGAGVVIEVGPGVTSVSPGDRVVMSYAWCGNCPSCRSGSTSYCHHFPALNFGGIRGAHAFTMRANDAQLVQGSFFGQSSFASHSICEARHLVKVEGDVPLELLAPLGCGVQTGAGAVINSLKVSPGSSLIVFGAGSVGLSAVMAAKAIGACKIIAVDPVESRRKLAIRLGADIAFDANQLELREQIQASARDGLDYALDTTGIPSVVRKAFDSLAIRGTCGVLGIAPLNAQLEFDARSIMSAGRTIRGIVEGDSRPADFIPRLVALHNQGLLPIEKLITTYPFDEINQAFEDSRSGKSIKPVLLMPS